MSEKGHVGRGRIMVDSIATLSLILVLGYLVDPGIKHIRFLNRQVGIVLEGRVYLFVW